MTRERRRGELANLLASQMRLRERRITICTYIHMYWLVLRLRTPGMLARTVYPREIHYVEGIARPKEGEMNRGSLSLSPPSTCTSTNTTRLPCLTSA
jgi:hypothetical protein